MIRALLFDFDYTLADSTAGAVECVNHALVRCGLPAADKLAICRSIAYPLPEVLARLTGVDDPAAVAAFAQAFLSRADEVMAPLTTLYPAVPATIAHLRREGYRTAIVSTKFRYRIESILANHDAGKLFDAIVGGEDVPHHKPHPLPLIRALGRLRLEPDEALYLGDHPVDAQAAEAAGVPFVAILSGIAAEAEFDGLPRKGMLSKLEQVPAWLKLWRQFERR